jgi:Ca2+-binding RTX toxin-like protein
MAAAFVGGVAEDNLISIENVWGGKAADILVGDDSDNTFRGGQGRDKIDGGAGVDTADYSDMTKSVVLKLSGSRSITVSVGGKADDKLKSIENAIGGSAGDKLTGDAGANTLQGGKGADTLTGAAGSDRLNGGKDADQFVFSTKLKTAGVDTIVKFEHDKDTLVLDDKVFKAVGSSLTAGEFYAKAGAVKAHDKSDHVIYNKTTGDLYYDKDGKGGTAAIHFATLSNHPASFDHADFAIV